LAIVELKTVENPDLPLQAGEYWSRVCRLQAQGDLARYGYFVTVRFSVESEGRKRKGVSRFQGL
jgi:hypothetical protein